MKTRDYKFTRISFENRRSFIKNSVAAAIASSFAFRSFAQDKTSAPVFPIATTLKGDFTLATVGDMIATHSILNEIQRTSPQLLDLLKADATFGNFEDTVVDLNTFKGYPEALSGGGWLLSSTQVPADLKAMGIDLVSHANNHATDWGVAGLLETDRRLSEAGLVHAGSGQSLTSARAPAYYEAKTGRVALIAMTAHFTEMEPAQDGAGNINARPGINPLRYEMFVTVPAEQFQQLAAIRDMEPEKASKDKDNIVTLYGTKYMKAAPGQTALGQHYKLNEKDEKDILRNIRQGKEAADFVIASAHVHEPGNYSSTPPDFLPVVAHDALDAGADVFVGHGPHRLRGIEIYKGKPIFYSLGDFIYMSHSREAISPQEYEDMKPDPREMTPAEIMQKRMLKDFNDSVWYESVIARSHYRDGILTEIELHPVELGWDGPLSQRGVPKIAPPKTAQHILDKLQKLSQPFGTQIEVRDNVGIIKINPATK